MHSGQQADTGGKRPEGRGREQGEGRADPGRARVAPHESERTADDGSGEVARDAGVLQSRGADPDGEAAEADRSSARRPLTSGHRGHRQRDRRFRAPTLFTLASNAVLQAGALAGTLDRRPGAPPRGP